MSHMPLFFLCLACSEGNRSPLRRHNDRRKLAAVNTLLRELNLSQRSMKRALLLVSCAASALSAQQASAQAPTTQPAQVAAAATPAPLTEDIIIFGRAERQIGVAAASSEGAVGGADLSVRPILRVAELLEVVPGLIAGQNSGSGKANQYFLRGINLDHGTDFTTYFDDVPLNFRSHGHGQGYLDVNGIIPETVTNIDYRKGPYRADFGDFALAGAAILTTVDKYDAPFALAEYGAYGWRRFVAGGSTDIGGGTFTLVGQWKGYDGPWEVPEELVHFSGYGKYTHETSLGLLEASLSGYSATWRPTEQIPERAIGHVFSEPGLPTVDCKDEFCAGDPTASGLTTRFVGSARLTGEDWHANIYSQFYN